jgi:hypothetical protein
MKKLICVTSVLMLALLGLSVCQADSMIPNLVGTWIVKSEGGVLLKGALRVSACLTFYSLSRLIHTS